MNEHQECILIVEDDKQIQNFIGYALQNAGFSYIAAETGELALNLLVTEPVDLVILDLGLPDIDGMDVIRKVREWSQLPIIIVSARDQDSEKVNALDIGADDYITKPFSVNELLARLRVAIRHLCIQKADKQQAVCEVGDLKIDFEKHLIYLHEAEIHLTPLEYRLLSLLFSNIGKVLTTQYILREVYGLYCGTDTQALRALMAGLRRKNEKVPSKPRYIMTEIGVGYRLVDE